MFVWSELSLDVRELHESTLGMAREEIPKRYERWTTYVYRLDIQRFERPGPEILFSKLKNSHLSYLDLSDAMAHIYEMLHVNKGTENTNEAGGVPLGKDAPLGWSRGPIPASAVPPSHSSHQATR